MTHLQMVIKVNTTIIQSGIHTGGEDLGYPPKSIPPPPPQKFHSVLTLFGIITTKYVYFTT